jgi:hypothetical protein
LNSSISAISERISGVMRNFARSRAVIHSPIRFHPSNMDDGGQKSQREARPMGGAPRTLVGVGAGADQLEAAENMACDSDRRNKARRQSPADFRAALRPALGTITPAIHRQTASSATASSEKFGGSLHHSFTWFLSAERKIQPNPAIRLGNLSCTIWTG